MLTPDTFDALRLQLAAIVVTLLILIANLPDDDPPPSSPQMASGAPLEEVVYEEIQYDLFPDRARDEVPYQKPTQAEMSRYYNESWSRWDGVCV